jgi:hypothetical protein
LNFNEENQQFLRGSHSVEKGNVSIKDRWGCHHLRYQDGQPNGGVYLANAAMHTFEHLFATYARNSSWSDHVIYVGPMVMPHGFIFSPGICPSDAIRLVQESFRFSGTIRGDPRQHRKGVRQLSGTRSVRRSCHCQGHVPGAGKLD